MPMNESSGYRPTTLTKEQRREAEAAIYGLKPINPMDNQELTLQEIERMRAIVAQYDRTTGRPEEFDLNNPKTPPYRYQKFPKTIYNHKKRENRIVQSEEELQEFSGQGWTDQPYPAEPEQTVQLDAASAAEVEKVDAQLAALRAQKAKEQEDQRQHNVHKK